MRLIAAAVVGLSLSLPFSLAQAQTAQQNLMGTCNKEAAGKKGQERKDFMKTCLSDGKKRQQEKMKACAAENKGKKGDEYKKAQSECLKK